MIGESFFAFCRELATSSSFELVAEMLVTRLGRELGADEMILLDLKGSSQVIRVIGDGALARHISSQSGQISEWISHCMEGGSSSEGNGEHSPPGLKVWMREAGGSDAMVTKLISGPLRSAVLLAWKERGVFDPGQLRRFRMVGTLAHCILRGQLIERHDACILEHLMHLRGGGAIAVLVARGNFVAPYNPGAVGYAEAYWGRDEVEFVLSEKSSSALWGRLAEAWTSPVDPHWTTVEIDLGCGPVKTGAISRPDGSSAVLMFALAPRQVAAPSGPVSMLTRRQCDIMDWIAEGKTSAEVAIILEISPRTVEKHLEAIFQRFGVENRVAAVRSYLEAKGGLLPS